MKIYLEKYNRTHKMKIDKYKLKYQINHKLELRKRSKDYQYNRKKTDENFKILCYLRTRIYKALKGYSKSKNTVKLLGCTVEFLKGHLESNFTQGMTWDNYGKWHVDHIKPCADFNLSKPSQQHKCFHYTNLQPLWALDNLKKNRY